MKTIGNINWIWLTNIFYGVVFYITIIGIPFGQMHFRLAKAGLVTIWERSRIA